MKQELCPIPNSTAQPREAVRVGVAVVPRSVIADIVTNPAAQELLPKRYKYLASPSYIANNIWMSVPEKVAERLIITPFSAGRVVPIAFAPPDDYIPMGNALARVVTGKGSWLSGAQLLNMNQGINLSSHHPGLLSVPGARDDTKISNALIEGGFRSALHLGYVVFDSDKLKKWLRTRWENAVGSYQHMSQIDSSFGSVNANGGAAYLLRLGGSTERYKDILRLGLSPKRLRVETMQAARMISAEQKLPDSATTRALKKIELFAPDAIRALDHLSHGSHMSYQEFHAYVHFIAAFFVENIPGVLHANTVLGDMGLNPHRLSHSKDVDLAHFTYDYDEASGTCTSNRSSIMEGYLDSAVWHTLRHFEIVEETFVDRDSYFIQILYKSIFQHYAKQIS